jgi:hypothetical protein
MFCDAVASQCLMIGTCARDEHCPVGQICDPSAGRCSAGCRTTADCNLFDVCIGGACLSNRCLDNDYCAAREFCDATTMTCGQPNLMFCQPCDMNCMAIGGTCLQPIIEGNPNDLFCGLPCMSDTDCPGGLRCDESFSQCFGANDACPNGLVCLETKVLNQMGTSFFCSDPTTMDPAPTGHFCSPRTARCPP